MRLTITIEDTTDEGTPGVIVDCQADGMDLAKYSAEDFAKIRSSPAAVAALFLKHTADNLLGYSQASFLALKDAFAAHGVKVTDEE